MIIKVGKKRFKVTLFHRVIPVGIEPLICRFENEKPYQHDYINGNRLSNKNAIVTGGSKGIGLAIAKRLLQDGANVIITGRNVQELQNVVDSMNNPKLSFLKWDISDIDNCTTYYKDAEKIFGRIDILVNNAGVTSNTSKRISFDDMDKEHYHFVHQINAIGTRQMCLTFSDLYDEGVILNIISNTSLRPAQDAYYSSKWALYSFTKAFSEECLKKGKKIMVNGLCPGPIKTDMSFDNSTSLFRAEIPNRRIGLPEEIAELVFIQIMSSFKGKTGMISVCDGGEILN